MYSSPSVVPLGKHTDASLPLVCCLSARLPYAGGGSPPSTWEPREALCVVVREVRVGLRTRNT